MTSRGSALTRVRQYFKTAELDEVEVAFELVKRDIAERLAQHKRAGLAPVRTRKPRTPKPNAAAAQEGTQETLANA